jgi:hypothetical protein
MIWIFALVIFALGVLAVTCALAREDTRHMCSTAEERGGEDQ